MIFEWKTSDVAKSKKKDKNLHRALHHRSLALLLVQVHGEWNCVQCGGDGEGDEVGSNPPRDGRK